MKIKKNKNFKICIKMKLERDTHKHTATRKNYPQWIGIFVIM